MAKPKKSATDEKTAPKRKTASKGSSSAVTAADMQTILDYLRKQNRPYNVNDIFNNLHGSIGRTAVVKILDKLVAEGHILEKPYGKTSIFVIKQNDADAPSKEELDAMDTSLLELKQQAAQHKEEWKAISAEINHLQNTLTLDEMKTRIAKLKDENRVLLEKIRDLESGTRKVDPVEKKKVDQSYDECMKTWKSRKRMCMDAIGMVTEHMSMKPKEFMIEAEMEDDPKN